MLIVFVLDMLMPCSVYALIPSFTAFCPARGPILVSWFCVLNAGNVYGFTARVDPDNLGLCLAKNLILVGLILLATAK